MLGLLIAVQVIGVCYKERLKMNNKRCYLKFYKWYQLTLRIRLLVIEFGWYPGNDFALTKVSLFEYGGEWLSIVTVQIFKLCFDVYLG